MGSNPIGPASLLVQLFSCGCLIHHKPDRIQMTSRVEELQERVIDLQLELRKLETKRKRLRKRVNCELDRLLKAKETLKRNRTICI
jgi:hypothetical protein